MNTLSRTLTAQFFNSQEDYNTLKAHWGKLVNSPRKKELRPEHHLLYSALLGRDWRKGFSPITNKVKLANGMRPYMGMAAALRGINWPLDFTTSKFFDRLVEPFDGLVTKEMAVALDKILPKLNSYDEPGQAYNVPEAVNAAA